MRELTRIGLALALLTLAGCGGSSSESTKETTKKKLTIAVIPKGTLHDFWKSIHAGAEKAAQELGNVEIIWKGPAQEDDREQQIQVVENFVTRGVDAIVLAPLDRTALVTPVESAMGRDVPVVIIDSGLESEEIVSYISTDNYNGGALAARHMGATLGGKGNVVVLRYQVGSNSTELREKGFLETLAKEFPDIKILSEEQFAGATREGAVAKAENLLTRFSDQINGWFCPCEPVTFGTLRALQNKGMTGKIKIVGFDAGDEVVTALRNGEVDALVLQDPINMGYLGVKTAVAHINGQPVDKSISTGEILVTKENMDEPKHKELHSPDLSKWLGE